MKIIVLTENKFDKRDYFRFGIDLFLESGFEVSVFDISGIVRTDEYISNYNPAEEIKESYVRKVNNHEELTRLLESENSAEAFITCYIGLESKTRRIFEIISSKNIRYAVFRIASLPSLALCKELFLRAAHYIKYNLLSPQIQPAAVAFFAGRNARKQTIGIKIAKSTVTREVGSLDYITYLKVKQSSSSPKENNGYPDIIFIDEYYPLHPDINHATLTTWIKPEFYYTKINNFLNEMCQKTGLTCGIAVHPRADYETNPFDFELHYNKTAELVNNAQIIVGHASTSFSFAILDNKPIIQVGFRNIKKTIYGKLLEKFSSLLDLPVCYLDDKYVIPDTAVNKKRYKKYVEDYIIADRKVSIQDHNRSLIDYLKNSR